jgi:hypothetical protein
MRKSFELTKKSGPDLRVHNFTTLVFGLITPESSLIQHQPSVIGFAPEKVVVTIHQKILQVLPFVQCERVQRTLKIHVESTGINVVVRNVRTVGDDADRFQSH